MEDNEDVPAEDADAELEARALAAVKNLIPAVRVAKNASKALLRLSSVRALSRLSSAGTDLFTTALEAASSRLRLAKARNEHLIAKISELSEFSTEQSAVALTVADRQIEEQHRIDQVVFEAIEHVQASEHSAPSGKGKSEEGKDEIDNDWLESFRREAADRSQGEMREAFVRILAGEIREPGTFSIKTVRTVGGLSQWTANLFRKAVSLRVGLEVVLSEADGSARRLYVMDARIPSLGGELGQNHLRDEGLSYDHLTELTENGFLHPDYRSWNDSYGLAMPRPEFGGDVTVPFIHRTQTGAVIPIPDPAGGGGVGVPFIHQGQKWKLTPLPTFSEGSTLRIRGAEFTTVGKELLHIVDIDRNDAFLDKVQSYLKKLHVEMVAL